jgi:hypothetical protein
MSLVLRFLKDARIAVEGDSMAEDLRRELRRNFVTVEKQLTQAIESYDETVVRVISARVYRFLVELTSKVEASGFGENEEVLSRLRQVTRILRDSEYRGGSAALA